MAMVAVVLLAIFSIICVINYQQAVADVYATLESAIDHDTMPKKEPLASAIPPATSDRSGESSAETDGRMPFEIGGKGEGKRFIPVAVYEIEYRRDACCGLRRHNRLHDRRCAFAGSRANRLGS